MIKDLEVGKIEEDTILYVKTIIDPFQILGVNLIVEDKNGDAVSLALYN